MSRNQKQRQPAAHADSTRSRIVEAAVAAFADRGFDAASTREIARRAGVEQGLLTYHFRSKDALWRAAADRVFTTLKEGITAQLSTAKEASPKEQARELIRTYVRTMATHPEFFRFIVDQGHRFDERTEWLVDTHIRPAFEMMKQLGLLQAAEDESELPHALFTLLGASTLIFSVPANCQRLTGVDPRDQAVIEAHADFVAALLVA
ncbi:MAG: TetR/AcrR family transcriptional regulator [Gammaproteobacteria bacterium]|jgi:AcrR family transcriptional regulator